MNTIDYISKITSIDSAYLILIIKTIVFYFIFEILKRICLFLVKRIEDNKKEYETAQRIKYIFVVIMVLTSLFLWSRYLKNLLTLISIISAGLTLVLRDIILNFFCGIYIKVAKPFVVEDRIEINEHKGDVVNINSLHFELLEVDNRDFTGQSTGVITNIPNSTIFSYPLRNYNKAFKYIWNEINVRVPLDFDMEEAKKVLFSIVNNNDIIKTIPEKMKKQINKVSNDYRIYYNQYNPTIYTKVVDNYVEYTIRYLVHPKKARYVNSSLWKHILIAYQNGEIELYKD